MIHNLIISLLVLVTLAGCSMPGLRWNKKKDEQIPVTSPASEADAEISASEAGDDSVSSPPPVSQAPVASDGQDSLPIAVDSKVVAASILQVNGQFITVRDIVTGAEQAFDSIPAELPEQEYRGLAEKIVRDEVRRQVTQAMVLAEAISRLTEQQEAFVDQEMERALREMVAQAGGSEQSLRQDMETDGIALDDVLDEYSNSMIVQIYLQQKLYPEIAVTREMLWDAYQRDRAKFNVPKKMQMQIISARFAGEASKADARKRIHDAAAAIEAGEDFADVAKRLSDGAKASAGGVWPLMAAGNFRHEQVEQAGFALELGQVSKAIEMDEAFFIVKAYRIEAAKSVSFEDAQEELSGQLRQQMYVKLSAEHFEKLGKAATIVESEKIVETAVDFALQHFFKGKP